MHLFKIGDKVVFKKEVLDKISKTDYAKSCIGVSLTREYYDYLMRKTDFEKLGYFDVIQSTNSNLYVGLNIGADLFEPVEEGIPITKSDDKILTTQKIQNNEIRFQKSKASCKRGTVPTGSAISGRKDKIAISIGHLSYQVCNC